MKKDKNIKNTIIAVGGGLVLIIIGLFTDYTLSIGGFFAIPQWATIVVGILLIVGWFILHRLPNKYNENGNSLKKE